MKCLKQGPDARHQYEWWQRVVPDVRPDGVRFDHERETLEYDFVEGVVPQDWQLVHQWAAQCLWQPATCAGDGVDPHAYIKYVEDRAGEAERRGFRLPPMTTIFDVLGRARYTPARLCHGDLTLKNCVLTVEGRLVFLDPGHDRGLRCVELDESKLMQSLDGFDVIYRGHPQPPAVPKLRAQPVHWALLATHYVRLLLHVRWQPALDFAVGRVHDIARLLA